MDEGRGPARRRVRPSTRPRRGRLRRMAPPPPTFPHRQSGARRRRGPRCLSPPASFLPPVPLAHTGSRRTHEAAGMSRWYCPPADARQAAGPAGRQAPQTLSTEWDVLCPTASMGSPGTWHASSILLCPPYLGCHHWHATIPATQSSDRNACTLRICSPPPRHRPFKHPPINAELTSP